MNWNTTEKKQSMRQNRRGIPRWDYAKEMRNILTIEVRSIFFSGLALRALRDVCEGRCVPASTQRTIVVGELVRGAGKRAATHQSVFQCRSERKPSAFFSHVDSIARPALSIIGTYTHSHIYIQTYIYIYIGSFVCYRRTRAIDWLLLSLSSSSLLLLRIRCWNRTWN